jgi:hypothetical protein
MDCHDHRVVGIPQLDIGKVKLVLWLLIISRKSNGLFGTEMDVP